MHTDQHAWEYILNNLNISIEEAEILNIHNPPGNFF